MRPARYKIYYGGRGGVKSWSFAEAIIRLCAKHPIRVLCTRETQNSIEESVHRILVQTIVRLGMQGWFHVTKTYIASKCGAMIKYRGLREAAAEDIKSYEDVDICWVEEAKNVSSASWDFLVPTIRKDNCITYGGSHPSEIWASFNPEDASDPVYKRFVVKPIPGSIIHKLNYDSNPHFPKVLEDERQYYLNLISEAENEAERKQAQSNYDHIWLGEFKTIHENLILRDKCVVEEFDEKMWELSSGRLYFGNDHGFAQDPATLIRFFIEDRVLYITHEAYGRGVELDDLPEFFDSVPDARKWPIKSDNSRPETISYLARQGFRISAADKWPGSVEDGIAHLRGFRKIVIHPRCKHAIDESKMYSYKKDPKTGEVLPIILDKHNHIFDAVRYGLDGFIQRRGNMGVWEALANSPG